MVVQDRNPWSDFHLEGPRGGRGPVPKPDARDAHGSQGTPFGGQAVEVPH